jgi:hypothetical protein
MQYGVPYKRQKVPRMNQWLLCWAPMMFQDEDACSRLGQSSSTQVPLSGTEIADM